MIEKTCYMIVVFVFVAISLTGCAKKQEPTRHPSFENFDMVQVKLSKEKGQITDNKYEFDFDKNCWKVQVRLLVESKIGGMLTKFSGKDSIKFGTETKVYYEQELEKYVEPKEDKK